jgi:hypothetical protein
MAYYRPFSNPSVPVSWGPGGGPQQAANLSQYMGDTRDMNMRHVYGLTSRKRAAGPKQNVPWAKSRFPSHPIKRNTIPLTSGYGGFGGFGGAPTAATGVFPDQVTTRASNRAFNQAMIDADSLAAQKQSLGRGLSLDAGTYANAVPQIAAAIQQASLARRELPMQDWLANLAYGRQSRNMRNAEISPFLRLFQGL